LLCAGPGRLTQAFGVTRSDNGLDLTAGGDLFLAPGAPVAEGNAAVSPRVGITVARERPWRFFEAGSPFLSRGGAPSPMRPRPSEARAASLDRVHPEDDG